MTGCCRTVKRSLKGARCEAAALIPGAYAYPLQPVRLRGGYGGRVRAPFRDEERLSRRERHALRYSRPFLRRDIPRLPRMVLQSINRFDDADISSQPSGSAQPAFRAEQVAQAERFAKRIHASAGNWNSTCAHIHIARWNCSRLSPTRLSCPRAPSQRRPNVPPAPPLSPQ